MTEESKQKAGGGKFEEEFNALPLDEKFSKLLQMEMATLNEAARYVADSSMKMIEKFGDALSDLGSKVEAEAKKATAANYEEPTCAKAEPKTAKKTATRKKPAATKE